MPKAMSEASIKYQLFFINKKVLKMYNFKVKPNSVGLKILFLVQPVNQNNSNAI